MHLLRNPNGDQFVQSVVLLPDFYMVFACTERSLKNIEKSCVNGASVLRCDTTFDTSFTNITLVDKINGKHPEFPGTVMLRFKKDESTYRRLALEILNRNPSLAEIKKGGA